MPMSFITIVLFYVLKINIYGELYEYLKFLDCLLVILIPMGRKQKEGRNQQLPWPGISEEKKQSGMDWSVSHVSHSYRGTGNHKKMFYLFDLQRARLVYYSARQTPPPPPHPQT